MSFPEQDPAADPSQTPAPNAEVLPSTRRRFRREADPEEVRTGDEEANIARRPRPAALESEEDSLLAEIHEEVRLLNSRVLELAEKRMATAAAIAEARGAKYFRLTRKATAPGPNAGDSSATSSPEVGGPLAMGEPTLNQGSTYREGPGALFWSLISLGVIGLTALAFILGRSTVRPAASLPLAAAPANPTWTQGEIALLDQVYERAQAGDISGATKKADALDKQLKGRSELKLLGSEYRVRTGQTSDAEAAIIRLVNVTQAPLEAAAAQMHVGFLAARRRKFDAAGTAFADATLSNPVDPLPFYYWGESLRRAGRLPDAINKFEQAILRLPVNQPESDSLAQCAALRIRLTKIELGDDADVKSALDGQLRIAVPSVYWLVTAVAYDLQHGNIPDSLSALQRMQVVSQPEIADALLNDYYLHALAVRNKEVSSYFPEVTAERRAVLERRMPLFIDP